MNEPGGRLSRARAEAAALLSRRAMSRGALMDKLDEKGFSDLSEQVADWLCEIGALDDARYAESLTARYSSRGYGLFRIRMELTRRGILPEDADRALMAIPDDGRKLDRLLGMRLRGREPCREELKRASDALYRRGFSWEEISEAIDRYMEDADE